MVNGVPMLEFITAYNSSTVQSKSCNICRTRKSEFWGVKCNEGKKLMWACKCMHSSLKRCFDHEPHAEQTLSRHCDRPRVATDRGTSRCQPATLGSRARPHWQRALATASTMRRLCSRLVQLLCWRELCLKAADLRPPLLRYWRFTERAACACISNAKLISHYDKEKHTLRY